jgi:hypothetical protein
MLGIGRSLAYQAVRSGQFPSPVIKVGARYLIPRAPLEALLLRGADPQAVWSQVREGAP